MTDSQEKTVTRPFRKLRPIAVALSVVVIGLVADYIPGRLGLDMLDRTALETSGRTLNDTASIFVTARAANAILSMARSFTVGVAITVSPGELLDPLDRAVDSANEALLVATTAAIISNIVLVGVSSIGLPILSLLIAAASMGLWCTVGARSHSALLVRRLCRVALVAVLAARLGLPAAVWSADRCAEALTSGRVEEATVNLRRFGAPAALISLSATESPATFDAVRTAAVVIANEPGAFVLSLATLIGVTILRVMVIPLLAITLLWRLARRLTAL
ncbi:MAG: hypothetical protein WCJ64_03350 [Rhodospirillaceae bacterium]